MKENLTADKVAKGLKAKQLKNREIWYTQDAGIITLLFLFFPAGLYLMFKYTKWSTKTKAIISGILLLAVIVAANSDSNLNTDTTSNSNQNTLNTQTSTEVKTPVVEKTAPLPVPTPPTPEQIAATEEANRLKQIDAQFSAWDGSHTKLKKLVKDGMNDADSFKHVETRYFDLKDHLIINMTFRGKNAYGGTVTNTIKAKSSIDGTTLEVLEQF